MSLANFLAFDLGAQSGRAILGCFNKSKLSLTEVHRFTNQPTNVLGHLHWNILQLFEEIKKGLKICVADYTPDLFGIGIDTWGVDFGFVGRNDTLLGFPYAYWDTRTDGMMEIAFTMMPKSEIYQHTGVQFMKLNSIFQLLSMVLEKSPILDAAEKLLFMPDLFNYLITGQRVSEYTIATTSQLYNSTIGSWAKEIFEKLNLPLHIMADVIQPGTVVGLIRTEIQQDIGIEKNIPVIAPACHDTASAVVAVPAQSDNWAYLSSGTWSLMGIEVPVPIITEASLQNNFTNEGGFNRTIRFLRNVMGLWLVQGCRQAWERQGETVDYATMMNWAENATPFKTLINPDDEEFFSSQDMVQSIVSLAMRTNQPKPETKGEVIRCVLESLALKYKYVLDMLNDMRGKPIEILHIVGGGVRNRLLNQLTANALGIPVMAGPIEATAIGNILVQAITAGLLHSLQEAREIIKNSFEFELFMPQDQPQWHDAYGKFCELFPQI